VGELEKNGRTLEKLGKKNEKGPGHGLPGRTKRKGAGVTLCIKKKGPQKARHGKGSIWHAVLETGGRALMKPAAREKIRK